MKQQSPVNAKGTTLRGIGDYEGRSGRPLSTEIAVQPSQSWKKSSEIEVPNLPAPTYLNVKINKPRDKQRSNQSDMRRFVLLSTYKSETIAQNVNVRRARCKSGFRAPFIFPISKSQSWPIARRLLVTLVPQCLNDKYR